MNTDAATNRGNDANKARDAAYWDEEWRFGMKVDANRAVQTGRPETVGLITPSHRGDLERSAMLFDSIDRHISRRGEHYVVVHDEDVALFAQFRRSDRRILPVSDFLPSWLRPVPGLRWRGRRYWWSFHGQPISGWHAQQIVKIQAAKTLPEERFCLIDSDNVFFRDFDLAPLARPNPVPMHVHRGGVTTMRPRHLLWIASSSRLLGIPQAPLPADDYIDQIIVWDKSTVQAMTKRIEVVTGRDWVAALCRERDYSEYMIYGSFVAGLSSAPERHRLDSESLCRTYWDSDVLSTQDVLGMLCNAGPSQVALCIQSFGSTPLSTISTSLEAFYSMSTYEKAEKQTEAA